MASASARRGRNIALLIDGDNASPATLDAALTILGDLGTVNVRRIYGNWSKPALKGWAALIHRHALEPQQQFDLTKGKNATDMKMTIDAMDLLYGGHVDGFGIMSSDSDFMPLAIRIRQNGTPVYGFGSSRTPEAFREACTRFIDIDAMVADEAEERPGKASAKPAVDDELVQLLNDAWKASKRDDDGFASLSEVGQRVANRSSFDARSYGFSRLSELVQSLPNFATEKRESGLYVKRMR
ncbi:NYN domain-containing protein [Novosphingobium album (ex Hu et al. 2023)]|uniref:NYN domain-containing protein n=1 Tax=Novosphingobium album (ex Hu et al. 2023) TaxID=2930093 RepID=A0ABT0AXW4_9SPHN|nr:NYN domain-containing protein [Novosphingobium album (ex Hu et al. 2023)]MCJ2177468.1 NYN domain-containing protein [Novosphingobium album (ex Hu et al. 2023)]